MIFVLKQFFFGTLKIQISGSQVRRFLRLCTSQGIKIWNIKYIDDMTYTCSILWSEIYGTKSSLRKTRSKIRILQRYGFPKWIKFWKKHLILFIFILFMIAGSLNLRRCVWHIEIDGNSYISDKLIMNMLDESGVTAGQKKSRIDVDEIEKYLRIKFDSICWASAHIEGTCLYINVEEEQFDPAIYEDTKAKDKCTNIYSKYDATITSIITRSGTACVKKNDEVKKGDLLVSGECPILDDNQEVTKYLYVNSDADVFGKVVYALCSVLLLVTIQRSIMNRSRLHFGFAFGNVTRIKRACRIGTRKIYYGFTFVFAEQTPIVFRSGKPCNMVFVSVRCDNVFQNIIRHEFIKIGFDCGNAVCLAAGVDQNIVFSRADVNTVARIFVAELEKMHRKIPVRNNSDCVFVKNGRRSIPASPVSFSRTGARVIGVRPEIQYVIYRLHRSHSACKPAPGKRGSDCYYNHRHNDYYRRSGQFDRLFFV